MGVSEFYSLPEVIESVAELEDVLSTPTAGLVEDFARLQGDILILGASGNVGPTLARMAKRAAPEKRGIGVARFYERNIKQQLEEYGIETITTDLLASRN
jgi:NADPH:quinone reductase-like Zn-dependent oxidoreductase